MYAAGTLDIPLGFVLCILGHHLHLPANLAVSDHLDNNCVELALFKTIVVVPILPWIMVVLRVFFQPPGFLVNLEIHVHTLKTSWTKLHQNRPVV